MSATPFFFYLFSIVLIASAFMVIAWAGQIASHSLQAMQRSSPLG